MGQKGGDVKGVFERLAKGIAAVGESVKAECGKEFQYSQKFGYIHSCPTNLGTGMRASVPVVPAESLAAKLVTLMTFPASIVWVTLKSNSSKRCTECKFRLPPNLPD